jgi:catechol 2,3-dioxygenase-like lactoylglutathione lyase family enzyme
MLRDGQGHQERFMAGVADELIMGHIDLPSLRMAMGWILDPWTGQVQSPCALRKEKLEVHCSRMPPAIEKIAAITFRVLNMKASVQFYRDVLGMELLYGGEQASFSSLQANNADSAILNLEQGATVSHWGRLIFHVSDVDAIWKHLRQRGFDPEIPRDASWGERYFHLLDPDGHQLSFAKPLR